MQGIDTNVLVRLLVEDDAAQTRRARKLVEQARLRGEPIIVSLIVLTETEWVLRSRYELDKPTTIQLLRRLLESRELIFEDEPAIEDALFKWEEANAGFTDCLIAAHHRRLGCTVTATFDKRAARVPGFVAV